MVISIHEKPFKDREEVKAEIKLCGLVGSIFQYLGFLFALLGIIGDALNITLGLESMTWLLLAVFFCLNAVVPHMHLVVAKHLIGMEPESKNK